MLSGALFLQWTPLPEKAKRFNEILTMAIERTITELLSPGVLAALYQHLQERYDVGRDELPYRLETMYTVLNEVFGVKAAKTIERQITKRFCAEFNIPFLDTEESTLEMYVAKAKELAG
jgi:hypothetical protein